MAHHQQETLLDPPPGAPARVWCRRCKRPLTDWESRAKRLGPECDPERRTGPGRDHHVDQDPIPGT
ncbi:DUF6011 domain-containing protein [Streptomyces sp. NPDC018584]|uniref:DUF6011 domain-containing protein n=1 Tax=unclassified Streptomyces TaxID=2593676 RepID=UPI003796C178